MKVSKADCLSGDPCAKHKGTQSGCMTNLTQIGIGSHKLVEPAAKAFIQMLGDMEKDTKGSVTKDNLKLTDSYRKLESQCRIMDWDLFHSKGGNSENEGKKGCTSCTRKVGSGGKTPVAYPGTSNHGWGRAVDLFNKEAQKWIKDNGYKYGWCWGEVKSEAWHFTYCGEGPNRSKLCDTICKGSIEFKQDPEKQETNNDNDTVTTTTTTKTGNDDTNDKTDSDNNDSVTTTTTTIDPKKDFKSKLFNIFKESTKKSKLNEEVFRINDLIKKIL